MGILVPTPSPPLVDRSSRQQALGCGAIRGRNYSIQLRHGFTCTNEYISLSWCWCSGEIVCTAEHSPFLDSRFEMNPSHHPGALYRPHCRFFEYQHKANIFFWGIIIMIPSIHSHHNMMLTCLEELTGLSMEVDWTSIPELWTYKTDGIGLDWMVFSIR